MTQRPGLIRFVVPVLGLAVLLNYVDRANLAIAAPLLQAELSLSGAELGVLLSSFFWVYAPAQVLAGWLVHRYDEANRSRVLSHAISSPTTGRASGSRRCSYGL